MATNRELVEAQVYNRRRLVDAFGRGASSLGEPDHRRPQRVVFGGIALGLLVLVGATVVGAVEAEGVLAWRS
jgi:hypothetical protein